MPRVYDFHYPVFDEPERMKDEANDCSQWLTVSDEFAFGWEISSTAANEMNYTIIFLQAKQLYWYFRSFHLII